MASREVAARLFLWIQALSSAQFESFGFQGWVLPLRLILDLSSLLGQSSLVSLRQHDLLSSGYIHRTGLDRIYVQRLVEWGTSTRLDQLQLLHHRFVFVQFRTLNLPFQLSLALLAIMAGWISEESLNWKVAFSFQEFGYLFGAGRAGSVW